MSSCKLSYKWILTPKESFFNERGIVPSKQAEMAKNDGTLRIKSSGISGDVPSKQAKMAKNDGTNTYSREEHNQ